VFNHVNFRFLTVEETRLARDLASALFQECRLGGHLPFCIVGPSHRPWFCCPRCLRGCSTSLAFRLYPRRYRSAVRSYCQAHRQRFPLVVRHQEPKLGLCLANPPVDQEVNQLIFVINFVHVVAEFLSFPTVPNTLNLTHGNPSRSSFRWNGSVFACFRPVKGLIPAQFHQNTTV
jgi:hypothetical protein